jgi:hypothetical protein
MHLNVLYVGLVSGRVLSLELEHEICEVIQAIA